MLAYVRIICHGIYLQNVCTAHDHVYSMFLVQGNPISEIQLNTCYTAVVRVTCKYYFNSGHQESSNHLSWTNVTASLISRHAAHPDWARSLHLVWSPDTHIVVHILSLFSCWY